MSGRSKVLAPVVTVVAVVAVAVTASLVGGGSGTSKPKVLRLAGGGSGAAQDLAPTSRSAIMAVGDYQLVGSLPAGTPKDASAWTLTGGAGPADPVVSLATALGEPPPKADKTGWTSGGLHVSSDAGRAWWWGPCAVAVDVPVGPDTAVSSSPGGACVTSRVGIAVSGGGGTSSSGNGGAPPPALSPPIPCPSPMNGSPECPPYVEPVPAATPSQGVVLAAARPVLVALGLGDPTPTVTTWPGGGSVQVDPKVDGLPTVGWTTGIDVIATTATDATVSGAHGWLAPASRGDSYPLIGAKAAFDRLPAMPRMMLACPEPAPDTTGTTAPLCPQPQPQRVTGAHLGLSLTWLADQQVALLPTWLFDVEGTDLPVPSVAVDPSYLDDGTSDGSGSGGASTEPGPATDPGAIEPAPDGYVPPAVEPTGPSEQIGLMGWRPSTADNAVTVLYENGGCGRTGVVADVKEDATQVYVFLRADVPPSPKGVCPAVSKAEPYEVALQEPLGDRTVIDGSTGKPAPRA